MNRKTEIIISWISKADHDLGSAIIIHRHLPEYKDTIAFHCQQAVEKYLKSYLIFLDIEFKRQHDLVYLAELINRKDEVTKELFDNLSELEDYAVEVRYPDLNIELTQEEIVNSINIAKDIRKFITNKMNISVDYDVIIDS
jgi:HEPN domain-containing protein